MPIGKGTYVRQKVAPPIEGSVERYSIDQETGETQVLVAWTDGEGQVHERFFKEAELEIIEGKG